MAYNLMVWPIMAYNIALIEFYNKMLDTRPYRIRQLAVYVGLSLSLMHSSLSSEIDVCLFSNRDNVVTIGGGKMVGFGNTPSENKGQFSESLLCSLTHSLIHSLTHSFTHSFIHSFILFSQESTMDTLFGTSKPKSSTRVYDPAYATMNEVPQPSRVGGVGGGSSGMRGSQFNSTSLPVRAGNINSSSYYY